MGRKRMLRQLAHSGRKCVWLIVAANPWYIIVRKMTLGDLDLDLLWLDLFALGQGQG
jgi:hypothetical protein